MLLVTEEAETSELLMHWVIGLLIFVPLLALRLVCTHALSLKQGRPPLPTPDTTIANMLLDSDKRPAKLVLQPLYLQWDHQWFRSDTLITHMHVSDASTEDMHDEGVA